MAADGSGIIYSFMMKFPGKISMSWLKIGEGHLFF